MSRGQRRNQRRNRTIVKERHESRKIARRAAAPLIGLGAIALTLTACGSEEPQPAGPAGAGGTSSSSNTAMTVGAGGDPYAKDECQQGAADCDENATCTDTSGYYRCACNPGFEGDGKSCSDIDECALGTHDCSPWADCTNAVPTAADEPGFSCACNPGFEGDGKSCLSVYTQLTVGARHSCAIRQGGTALCWGSNQNQDGVPNATFMLGNETPAKSARPLHVGGPAASQDWVVLAASNEATLGIEQDGSLWQWGEALGAATTSAAPALVSAGPYDALATGATAHHCAIKVGGALECWGKNDTGQLGIGPAPATTPTPTEVLGGLAVDSVTVGSKHSCAITTTGQLYCWGKNADGQLGDGSKTDHSQPKQVGTESDWKHVAAGRSHSCAVKAGGTLYCWGKNTYGQLGTNTGVSKTGVMNPALSPTKVGDDTSWTEVAAFGSHTCGLKDAGNVFCWGRSYLAGTTGDGSTHATDAPSDVVPQQVGAANGFEQIRVGDGHACARKTGRVLCWGANLYGATGIGTTGLRTTAKPLALDKLAALSTGSEYACAITESGTLFCWGDNSSGQLGTADRVAHATPTQVGTDADWIAIAASNDLKTYGSAHTCGIRDENQSGSGTLHCWGDNAYKQSGKPTPIKANGTYYADVLVPQQVGSESDWAHVTVGLNFSCAQKIDGSVHCWGRNEKGEQGTGQGTNETPQSVTGNFKAKPKQLVSRHQTVLAIAEDGSLWGWGHNADVLSGHPTKAPPIQLGTDTDWQRITLGARHACATKTNGTLHCWGNGTYGKLGLGGTGSSSSPTLVVTSSPWRAVAASDGDSTCGLQGAENQPALLYCWGGNHWAQLGLGHADGARTSPALVSPVANWDSIHMGKRYGCAIDQSKQAHCWGANHHGKTGFGDAWVSVPTQVIEPSPLPPTP